MDYKSIVAPYLNNLVIEEKAEIFRKNFWSGKIPVEIEDIIELKLGINIFPIVGFLKSSNMDAFITSDWKKIYVDNDEYLDERRNNRLRFSLAHEIGHFVIHKQIYESFNIKTKEDYHRFYKDISERQYGYLEIQANKFASYLLIPRKVLSFEAEKEFKSKNDPRLDNIDRRRLNSYLAKPLSKIFKVSEEAVAYALEGLTS